MIDLTEGFSVLSLADVSVTFAGPDERESNPKPLGNTLGSFVLS